MLLSAEIVMTYLDSFFRTVFLYLPGISTEVNGYCQDFAAMESDELGNRDVEEVSGGGVRYPHAHVVDESFVQHEDEGELRGPLVVSGHAGHGVQVGDLLILTAAFPGLRVNDHPGDLQVDVIRVDHDARSSSIRARVESVGTPVPEWRTSGPPSVSVTITAT